MKMCGYGDALNFALGIYVALLFLSNADADESISSPFSAHVSQAPDSITSLVMSVKRSALKGSFVESLPSNKPTSNTIPFSRKLIEEESRELVSVRPAFEAETEKDQSLSITISDSGNFSLSRRSAYQIEDETKHIVYQGRRLISSTLPAEPKQIARHNNSGSSNASSGTVPSLPVEGSDVPCDLDLLDVNFGGVAKACSVADNDALRRRRCCPVLAAWVYSAHLRMAFQPPPPEPFEMPVPPDDSQVCSATLQAALQDRNIRLSPPNASCDLMVCLCGIRLRRIESLSCPVKLRHGTSFNFTATPIFRAMEINCTDPFYNGCKNCLATLEGPFSSSLQIESFTSKTNAADCRMMGLLWLLATNRTIYLPTVSAVLRALVYQSNSMQCSLDKEHMPLAYDYAGPAHPSSGQSKYQWSFLVLTCFLLTQFVHIR